MRRSTHTAPERTCGVCKIRSASALMLRISRLATGEIVAARVGGRGVWICAERNPEHESGLRVAVSRGLRGAVSGEDVEAAELARHTWLSEMRERRGA